MEKSEKLGMLTSSRYCYTVVHGKSPINALLIGICKQCEQTLYKKYKNKNRYTYIPPNIT